MPADRPLPPADATVAPDAAAAPEPAPDAVLVFAQLADAAGHASTLLFNYRRDNPDAPDVPQALALEMSLDQRAIDLRTRAVTLLGAQSGQALAQLQDATKRIDDFLAGVKAVQARLGAAAAVVRLAGAALSGDAGGILGAVADACDAIKALKA